MATMQGESFAAKPISVSLLARRRKITAPDASRPTMLQIFLPRSMPSTETVMIYPSGRTSGEPITPEGGAGHPIKLSRPRGGDSRKRGSWQADRDLVSDAMKADSLHYEAVRQKQRSLLTCKSHRL